MFSLMFSRVVLLLLFRKRIIYFWKALILTDHADIKTIETFSPLSHLKPFAATVLLLILLMILEFFSWNALIPSMAVLWTICTDIVLFERCMFLENVSDNIFKRDIFFCRFFRKSILKILIKINLIEIV